MADYWRDRSRGNISTEERILCNKMYWDIVGEPDEFDYEMPESMEKEDSEYYRYAAKVEFEHYWKKYGKKTRRYVPVIYTDSINYNLKNVLLLLHCWKKNSSSLYVLPLELVHKICKIVLIW